jgi:LacI family transcriptional regulator
LRDVGRRARVDPSVVSKLLSGDPSLSVRPETRQKVWEAIHDLGYHRNALARGLRMARTMTIGYLLPDLVNPANAALVGGAQRAAAVHSYTLIIGSVVGYEEAKNGFARLLGEGRVDGLLVNTGAMTDDEVLALGASDRPVVLVNRSVKGAACSVIFDDEAAATTGTNHLIDLGHRRLAHIGGPELADTAQRRRTGFLKAARRGKATASVAHAAGWGVQEGYTAAMRLLETQTPTGVLAANVPIAMGVIRAGFELGLQVPTDLSVIAMHDSREAQMTIPALTTVTTPIEELGATAVHHLVALIEGRKVPRLTMVGKPQPAVIQRQSTARYVR